MLIRNNNNHIKTKQKEKKAVKKVRKVEKQKKAISENPSPLESLYTHSVHLL